MSIIDSWQGFQIIVPDIKFRILLSIKIIHLGKSIDPFLYKKPKNCIKEISSLSRVDCCISIIVIVQAMRGDYGYKYMKADKDDCCAALISSQIIAENTRPNYAYEIQIICEKQQNTKNNGQCDDVSILDQRLIKSIILTSVSLSVLSF